MDCQEFFINFRNMFRRTMYLMMYPFILIAQEIGELIYYLVIGIWHIIKFTIITIVMSYAVLYIITAVMGFIYFGMFYLNQLYDYNKMNYNRYCVNNNNMEYICWLSKQFII